MSVLVSSFLAVDVGSWFVSIWEEHLNPWWESFRQVFVGPDLWVQVVGIVVAFLIALIVTAGLRPFFRKVTDAIEERDDWIESTVDWVSDNLFRVLLVALLWSVSMYLDGDGGPAGMNYILVRAMASVATLWLVSAALPAAIKKQVYFKTLFFVLAIVLVLNLLGVWAVIQGGLDEIKLFPVNSGTGQTRVTMLLL